MPNAPGKIVVDSGPIIALFDAGDAHHRRAMDFVRQTRARLISNLAVITEAMFVLDDDLRAGANLLAWLHAGGLELIEPKAVDFKRASELIEKYTDLPMDFTDAMVVAHCERLEIQHIASVDKDFGIYRYKGRQRFVNMFQG